MSIKQTSGHQEDLLLLLPASGKWLSGDTYKLGEIVPYAEFKKSFGRLLKRVTLPDTKMSMNQSGIATVRRKAFVGDTYSSGSHIYPEDWDCIRHAHIILATLLNNAVRDALWDLHDQLPL